MDKLIPLNKILETHSIVTFRYFVLLQSKIKTSWVMSAINTKRCLKNVKRNEGVIMVTYSTMSCFGLPVSGVQLTDHSWPSADRRKKPTNSPLGLWAGVVEQEGSGGEVWQFTGEDNPAPSQCIPSPLSPNLFACVLSYFLQLLTVWTARF